MQIQKELADVWHLWCLNLNKGRSRSVALNVNVFQVLDITLERSGQIFF